MSREHVLHKVRTALGRSVGQAIAPAPAPRLVIPAISIEDRIARFFAAIERLAGKTHLAASRENACRYVSDRIGDSEAVASNSQFLAECGITALPKVRSGWKDPAALREACATLPFGITSADYALADTGTLVMLPGDGEMRLVSLLPPVHLAVVPRERILTGLDELLTEVPLPVEERSAMVLITGPSRTADIEQILVRGVHGPGEIHVIVV
jgi:L-lactate utilization protein LutC